MLSHARQRLDDLPPLKRVGMLIGILSWVLLPLIGAWLVWEVTYTIGAGLSPDSVNYLYMAQQWVAGNGFITIDPTLVPLWSPGYTVFLAVISVLTGLNPFQFANEVNIILFAITIVLAGYLGWRTMGVWSPLLWVAVGRVALSDDLLAIYAMAWLEPLFIVMSLFMFIAMQNYGVKPDRRNLVILTLIGAGVCLARYSGLVAVPVVGVAMLLWGQGRWVARLRHGMVFAVGAVVPVVLWMVRNSMATGTLMEDQYPSQMPLMTNIRL